MTPRELLDAFDVLAEAPEGIARLRELVLQLAVRGRLVPQDPGDELASVLLERMVNERAKAQGAAKSSKQTSALEINGDELPYVTPAGWKWVPFSQVAEIASNLVPPDNFRNFPHVAPDSIEKATGRLLAFRTVAEDGVTSGKHRFYAGQILYSKIRPNLSKVVKIDFDGLCSADMYPIDPWIDRCFLHIFMLSSTFLDAVTAGDNRVAMPKVNQEQLQSVPVAVPPLSEQHRIVARVDALMALCDDLERRLSEGRDAQAAFAAAAVHHLDSGHPEPRALQEAPA